MVQLRSTLWAAALLAATTATSGAAARRFERRAYDKHGLQHHHHHRRHGAEQAATEPSAAPFPSGNATDAAAGPTGTQVVTQLTTYSTETVAVTSYVTVQPLPEASGAAAAPGGGEGGDAPPADGAGGAAPPAGGEQCGPATVTVTAEAQTVTVTAGGAGPSAPAAAAEQPPAPPAAQGYQQQQPKEAEQPKPAEQPSPPSPAPTTAAAAAGGAEEEKQPPVEEQKQPPPTEEKKQPPATTEDKKQPPATEAKKKEPATSGSQAAPEAKIDNKQAPKIPVSGGNAPTVGGGKRGVGYDSASLLSGFADSGVSWAHNWHMSTDKIGLDFVPTLKGRADVGDFAQKCEQAIAGGAKALFTFNEPDMVEGAGGSNIPPQEAAQLYQKHVNPFAGKIALGAPSVTSHNASSGATGFASGMVWLQQFADACAGNCKVDFVNLHFYGGEQETGAQSAEIFKKYVDDAIVQSQAIFGKKLPVWMTEFSTTPQADTGPQAMAKAVDFLSNHGVLEHLEQTCEKYAYFMAKPNNLVDGSGGLTGLGKKYAG